MKIILLNKITPNTLIPSQIRLVCAINVVLKIMVYQFNDMLHKIFLQLPDFTKFQVSFLSCLSTQINIARIMTQADQHVKLSEEKENWIIQNRNNPALLTFIDFQEAYNSINREKLLEQLMSNFRNYQQEIQFLRWNLFASL